MNFWQFFESEVARNLALSCLTETLLLRCKFDFWKTRKDFRFGEMK